MSHRAPNEWTLSQLLACLVHRTGHLAATVSMDEMAAFGSSIPSRIEIDDINRTVTVSASRPTTAQEKPEKAGASDR